MTITSWERWALCPFGHSDTARLQTSHIGESAPIWASWRSCTSCAYDSQPKIDIEAVCPIVRSKCLNDNHSTGYNGVLMRPPGSFKLIGYHGGRRGQTSADSQDFDPYPLGMGREMRIVESLRNQIIEGGEEQFLRIRRVADSQLAGSRRRPSPRCLGSPRLHIWPILGLLLWLIHT